MPRGVMFVSIAALAGGTWSVLVSRASREMSPVLGPIIAETTGVIIALVLLTTRFRETTLEYSTRGITLLLLAGVCVFSVDYFSLRAYGTHLPVTVGAPIFMGGVILVATIIGLRFLPCSPAFLAAVLAASQAGHLVTGREDRSLPLFLVRQKTT